MLDRVTALPNLVRADDGGDFVLFCPAASHIGSETDSDTLEGRTDRLVKVKLSRNVTNALVCSVLGPAHPEDRSTASRTAVGIGELQHSSSYTSLELTISPSCPGCFCVNLGILRISSSMTSSRLKRPPWTTKCRLTPW